MPGIKPYFVLIMACGLLIFTVTPTQGQTPATAERIAFAGYRHGQWDIYSLAPDGSDPRQLTDDAFEDTDPAYAPDGSKIAFASRRNNNWDVYILDLQTGRETRLTTSPEYDGAPTWSPDSQSLAYESHQAGNLDIWRVAVAGDSPATNLTADSLAGDFAPAWSPTGQTIALTSWRQGDKDLFLLNVSSGRMTRLTETPTAEEWPAWHPEGDRLLFVINNLGDREVFRLDVANPPRAGEPVQPVTWLGRTDGPVWSPTGQAMAAVFHRWDGEIIMLQTPGAPHQLPQQLTPPITVQGRLTWHAQAVNAGQVVTTLLDTGPSRLYEETVTPNELPIVEPYNLIRINDIKAGTPWLTDTVDDSFRAWRLRVHNEVGYDFLAKLSDALRELSQVSDTSQYASWHKTGRAIDMLFDYHLDGILAHEIVREDYSGDTYWRIFLRCVDQSGSCGRPIVNNPWNYSGYARTVLALDQGGIEKTGLYLSGYYVDLTALAREYGWERISSYDDQAYSWTWHFLAFEYWHYEKRLAGPISNATTWYETMQEVYPPERLEPYFTWTAMRAAGDDPHLIAYKGVSLPLEIKPWWALVQP